MEYRLRQALPFPVRAAALLLAPVRAGALLLAIIAAGPASAAPPPIRTGPASMVPACVTPDRLMAFIASRNSALEPRFQAIAGWYKTHGETWGVRWDYAFFQMVIETNYLLFRRGDGTPGDVKPKQNNFAGLGTTGGGVPGDSYPDVPTGVLAQIQHLVAYSGERVANPIGPRTQLKQDDIIQASAKVTARRPMTFADLAGRWAADRAYARSIETIADRFRAAHCTGPEPRAASQTAATQPLPPPPAPQPARAIDRRQTATTTATTPTQPDATPAPPPAPQPVAIAAVRAVPLTKPQPPVVVSRAATPAVPPRCRVLTASYGGAKAVLIRSMVDGEQQLTALEVHHGFEHSMVDLYMRKWTPGGAAIGEFASQAAAVARANEICTETAGG